MLLPLLLCKIRRHIHTHTHPTKMLILLQNNNNIGYVHAETLTLPFGIISRCCFETFDWVVGWLAGWMAGWLVMLCVCFGLAFSSSSLLFNLYNIRLVFFSTAFFPFCFTILTSTWLAFLRIFPMACSLRLNSMVFR